MRKTVEVIAQALREEGVDLAFGIPGGEVLDLLEAFREAGIRFVLARQELGAGFMAEAYYQLTGRPGLLVATLGPGVTGVATPVAQAFLDRSALIAITGAVGSSLAALYTHQIIGHSDILRPITKWTTAVAARGASAQIRKGIALAKAWMPGPVHLDLAADVAAQEQLAGRWRAPRPIRTVPGRRDVEALAERLSAARRPLALVGLGVQLDGAEGSLRRFVEAWRVPVVTTYKAKGVVPEDHPLALGAAGLSPVVDRIHMEQVRDADLVLAIGFDPVELRSDWLAPWDDDKQTVSIDLVPNTHHVFRASIEYVGSIGGFLDALSDAVGTAPGARWPDEETARLRGLVTDAIAHRPDRGLGPYQVVSTLRRVFPRDTIATIDTGSHRILADHVWQAYEPRTLLQSNGLGSMGYALPAAIAAKLVHPGRAVLAMTGDAGLDMVAGEMATLFGLGLPVTVVVFRDAALSLIRLKQERMGHPEFGVTFSVPDYAALARAYGGDGIAVSSVGELAEAAATALGSTRFTIIDAHIDPSEYRKQM